ncbi:hypothetical protein CYMTET_7425, partial [Cymbomonas tetramitiformis]
MVVPTSTLNVLHKFPIEATQNTVSQLPPRTALPASRSSGPSPRNSVHPSANIEHGRTHNIPTSKAEEATLSRNRLSVESGETSDSCMKRLELSVGLALLLAASPLQPVAPAHAYSTPPPEASEYEKMMQIIKERSGEATESGIAESAVLTAPEPARVQVRGNMKFVVTCHTVRPAKGDIQNTRRKFFQTSQRQAEEVSGSTSQRDAIPASVSQPKSAAEVRREEAAKLKAERKAEREARLEAQREAA